MWITWIKKMFESVISIYKLKIALKGRDFWNNVAKGN